MIISKLFIVLRQYIKDIQLKPFFIEQQILVLAMYIYQSFAQHFHLCKGSRCIVDESTAFSIGRQFPANDTLFRFIFNVVLLKECFHVVSGNTEFGFYHTFGSPVFDCFHIGTLSKQQPDGS